MDGRRIQDPALEKLTPPIPKTNPLTASSSTTHEPESLHPAITFEKDKYLQPNRDACSYLALDLKTPRLNDIHQHLWLAGLPNAAQPLHRQSLLADNLCSDQELRKSACGLLLSYAWLMRHKSDLDIAKESGLVSKNIEWPNWAEFLEAFLDNINLETLSDVNKRYKYGELRLSRLNAIYRLIPPAYSMKFFIRGYRAESTWYNAFFGCHFKWMLAVFAVLSVFLSALQVGLATRILQDNGTFQSVSYGFALAAVVSVVGSVAVVFFVWLGLFWYYLLSTRRYAKAVDRRRDNAVSSP
ncbi:uncharacterized protein PAC_15319 [Phialocephala subalpina]|uniref:Uncharacterized protein n=1 Tax=Phialocephala subalpina TaxID=576137 RepID=A0A1L7XK52_9HELO|nr:uncharacterized protein PAC_15319 [Phialocephala subalpina]